MHINPFARSGSKTAHRTMVALPVLLGICVLSLQTVWSFRADVLTADSAPSSERGIVLPSGGRAFVMPGASFDLSVPAVLDGEVLLAHASMSTLHAGSLELQGWHGGFSVTKHNTSTTIAALSTPVLVQRETEQLLVPIGMQVRLDTAEQHLGIDLLKPLPEFYLRERLQKLGALPPLTFSEPVTMQPLPLPEFLDVLRLPSAEMRNEEEVTHARLVAFFQAFADQDKNAVQSLLLDPQTVQALQSPAGIAMMPDLAVLALESSMQGVLMPFLLQHQTLWLLASLHPALRDYVWVTATDATPDDALRLVRIGAVPLSDLLPQALSALAVQGWKEETQSYLHAHEDQAPKMLDELLLVWADVVMRQTQAALPERVQRYAVALAEIAEPFRESLSTESQALLEQIAALPTQLTDVRFEVSSSSANSRVTSSEKERVIGVGEYGQGKETALAALRSAGGMETEQTSVTALGGQTVRVIGMMFATAQGDQAFSFVFDAGTSEVRDIVKDGKVLPYPLTLEQFVNWLKSE